MSLALLAALLLAAQPDSEDCENAIAQQDMNRCAHRDFEKADAQLNAQWRKTLEAMRGEEEFVMEGDDRPGAITVLREAQRAWIAFRDAHCTVYAYQARGGSMEPMLYSGCRAGLTRERTRELLDLVIKPLSDSLNFMYLLKLAGFAFISVLYWAGLITLAGTLAYVSVCHYPDVPDCRDNRLPLAAVCLGGFVVYGCLLWIFRRWTRADREGYGS